MKELRAREWPKTAKTLALLYFIFFWISIQNVFLFLENIVRLMQHFFPGFFPLVSVQISSYNHRPI